MMIKLDKSKPISIYVLKELIYINKVLTHIIFN